MNESSTAELLLLAHLRRVVIGEVLESLEPSDAYPAISAAIQRLAQYRDEGRTHSTAQVSTDEQFYAAIDRVIEELREMRGTPPLNTTDSS